MAIIRKVKKGFTIISNSMLADGRLSFKARGLLSYMLSMSDGWQFYTKEVAKHSDKDGIDSIRSGLRELEAKGYLKKERTHKDNGDFGDMEWTISDTPMFDAHVEKAHVEKAHVEKAHVPNPTLTNNNLNNKQSKQELKEIYSHVADKPATISPKSKSKPKPKPKPKPPYKEIVDYLNKKVGTHYKSTSRATQSLIKARVNEGYMLDDFKKVIDNKCFDWQTDSKMKTYLRPSTLFASKFDDYLNENDLKVKQSSRLPTKQDFENVPDDLKNHWAKLDDSDDDDNLPF